MKIKGILVTVGLVGAAAGVIYALARTAGGRTPPSPSASVNLIASPSNITYQNQPMDLIATVQNVTVPEGTPINFQLFDGTVWVTFQVAFSSGNFASITVGIWPTSAKMFRVQCQLPSGTTLTSNTVTITTPW